MYLIYTLFGSQVERAGSLVSGLYASGTNTSPSV